MGASTTRFREQKLIQWPRYVSSPVPRLITTGAAIRGIVSLSPRRQPDALEDGQEPSGRAGESKPRSCRSCCAHQVGPQADAPNAPPVERTRQSDAADSSLAQAGHRAQYHQGAGGELRWLTCRLTSWIREWARSCAAHTRWSSLVTPRARTPRRCWSSPGASQAATPRPRPFRTSSARWTLWIESELEEGRPIPAPTGAAGLAGSLRYEDGDAADQRRRTRDQVRQH